jgi:phage tail sheath protein FI
MPVTLTYPGVYVEELPSGVHTIAGVAVFEPNDEPLWAQIRLNVCAFMQGLFRQGAFQGSSPKDAYFVKCSSETTTQTDVDNGVVNIVVGFAPLKPAEFVVIQIQPIAQQP